MHVTCDFKGFTNFGQSALCFTYHFPRVVSSAIQYSVHQMIYLPHTNRDKFYIIIVYPNRSGEDKAILARREKEDLDKKVKYLSNDNSLKADR